MTLKNVLPTFMFFFFLLSGLSAQEINPDNPQEVKTSKVIVKGAILDSLTKAPLEFGSVMLINADTKEELAMNTDSLGRFEFDNVKLGHYNLHAFYAGYPKLEKKIQADGSSSTINLGPLVMKPTNTSLKEVRIVSFRELIEQRPDGIVYNAERDGTNQGTTSEELLRKVPMLTVDLDGNVQMRGSSNVKVFIDGKPSTIIAASLKDALKQIPSDNIKSVEVITSPGAKYDAEGTAGVINIITKKSLIKGINGMAYSSLNYKLKQELLNAHLGGSINYRNNNFGLSANFGGGSWSNISESHITRTDFPNTARENVLKQSTTADTRGQYFYGGLSADYQIDTLNTIQAGFNINPGKWKVDNDQNTTIPESGIDYVRSINMENPMLSYSINGAYNKKFKRNVKQTLDILALYSVNNGENGYDLTQEDNQTKVINYKEKNTNTSDNNEFTLQADYAHPFKNHNQKLETGLKYINRKVGSNYELYNWFNQGNGSDFALDPGRSNALNYTQQVASAYGQFSSALAKGLNTIVGLRYEYTNIEGHVRDNGGKFTSDFHNLLPSAIVAWDLKNFNKLKISYNQRIERPSFTFINPYVNYSDPYNIQMGNPELEPELIHNTELGYSTLLGKSAVNISAFWRRTNNAIEATTQVGTDGISRTTFDNIAQNNTWGANIFGSTQLFSRWMLNLSGNIYYKELFSPSLDIRNDGIEYDFHVYSNLKIIESLFIEGFGMYRSNRVMLQGESSGFYYYRLGLKKSIFNGKADLTFGAENFLTPSIKIKTDYKYQNADYHSESIWYGRGIKLSLSYRFGKMSFSGPKKTIQNDDLKSGETQSPADNQMGG